MSGLSHQKNGAVLGLKNLVDLHLSVTQQTQKESLTGRLLRAKCRTGVTKAVTNSKGWKSRPMGRLGGLGEGRGSSTLVLGRKCGSLHKRSRGIASFVFLFFYFLVGGIIGMKLVKSYGSVIMEFTSFGLPGSCPTYYLQVPPCS